MTKKNNKVLLASKSADFSVRLTKMLSAEGYEVVRMDEIQSLITRIYDEMPHVVIADVHISDAAAFDFLSQMKLDVILRHIPLIVCTDSLKLGKKIDCGADLYLHKPILTDELVYHTKRLVEVSNQQLDVNPLTDMPGNRSSVERVEAAIKSGGSFALCYIDIRNLFAYNQAYGAHRGDFLIRETGQIIKEVVGHHAPRETFMGHLGGDDFVVLTDCVTAAEISEKIIDQFDKSIAKLYERDDRERGYIVLKDEEGAAEHFPFARLTIAIVTNEAIGYKNIADLTKTALQIQRYLKRFPGSAYLKDRRRDAREIYSGPMRLYSRSKIDRRVKNRPDLKEMDSNEDLKAEVRRILKSGNIDVFLQPIVSTKTKRIFGYESLSWFPRPDGSYWNTVQTFQMAREADLIREFDVLCARKALQNAAGLPAQQKLFVNLNRETFLDPECLEDILKDTPVRTQQIIFELTEQSFISETDVLQLRIKELRKRGIQLAVDDMGGGCVSLRETAQLLPEFLKFDRSLVRDIHKDPTKQQIMMSLLVFAKGIKARTTAEGIEKREEMRYLQKIGVTFGQGYLIAKPWKMGFAQRPSHSSPKKSEKTQKKL